MSTVASQPELLEREASPPAIEPDDVEHRLLTRVWGQPAGLYGWIVASDHKIIALRFIITAFTFFMLGGVLALVMRLQLARPLNHIIGPDLYNQFFTTHGTTMMFLFAVPIMQGFGLYLVPIMVGTRNVSFPRLLNFSYYVYLSAGIMLYAALILNTGPDMGWFSYVPLAGPDYSPGKRVDVWSQMVTLVEISTLAAAVEIITTAFKQRAPGMGLARIPIYVWSMVVTSFMIIFAMPAIMLSSTMLAMDRMTRVSTHFFNQAEAGHPLLWQHLFWFFAHPEVYIIFLPATGFISSILPTFSRRKEFGYTALVLSQIATAFIGFGVWVHHMFATPLPEIGKGLFTGASLMIVIPSAVQVYCWTSTMWSGKIRLKTPLLFVLGYFAVFLIGGLTGVMLASVRLDLQVHDTFFVVAHLHYVLIGGAVFPLFGALYYWFPKWTGRMLDERLGWWNFALLFIGFNLTFFPMHTLGLRGMSRRVYTYLPEQGWGDLNLLATIGSQILAMSVLLFLLNVWWSRRNGLVAGDNPWGAGTLEWATSSPPPPYSFRYIPVVQGREPVWEDSQPLPVVTGLSMERREVLVTTLHDAVPDHRHELAPDSIWPFLTALVVGGSFTGLVFHPKAFPIGLVGLLVTLVGWLWPRRIERGAGAARREHELEERGSGASIKHDVAHLPSAALDARSTSWWANTLLLMIETTTVCLLIASYLYLWRNYEQSPWPPPRVDILPTILKPVPDLLNATLGTIVLIGSCGLMGWLDWIARRHFARLEPLTASNASGMAQSRASPPGQTATVLLGLLGLFVLGCVVMLFRFSEFPALKVTWSENAYGGLVWSILGLHLSYIVLGIVELAVLALWISLYGLDKHQTLDLTLTATYWYWVAGTWVVIYGLVYWLPRMA